MTMQGFLRIALLSTSLLALASCEAMKEWRQGMTGERIDSPQPEGPRRMPIYNATALKNHGAPMVEQVAAPVAAPAPVQAAPATSPKPDVDYTAYDRFDEQGNEIDPEAMAVKAAPQAGMPAPAPISERKTLPGNPQSAPQEPRPVFPAPRAEAFPPHDATEVIDAEPVNEARPVVLSEAAEATSAPAAAPKTLAAETPVQSPAAPAQEQLLAQASDASAPATAQQDKNFFNSIGDAISRRFTSDNSPAQEEFAEYPKLSAVPATPEPLKDARATREDRMQLLLEDHAQAQQERREIESEPSELNPLVPPQMQPDPAPKAQEGQEMEIIAEEVTPQPAPAETAHQEPQKPAETAAPQKPWYERLNIFAAQPQPAPEPAQPPQKAAIEAPAAHPEEPTVLRSASGEELPSLRAPSAPLAPISASDESADMEQLLPSSRYSGRTGAR